MGLHSAIDTCAYKAVLNAFSGNPSYLDELCLGCVVARPSSSLEVHEDGVVPLSYNVFPSLVRRHPISDAFPCN